MHINQVQRIRCGTETAEQIVDAYETTRTKQSAWIEKLAYKCQYLLSKAASPLKIKVHQKII